MRTRLSTLVAVLACVLLVAGCTGAARDLIMLMERGHSLMLDKIEDAVAKRQLDDRTRRDVVRVAEGQVNAAIAEARKTLAASPGVKLTAEDPAVERYDAAIARFDAAMSAAAAETTRQDAARERRQNETLDQLFGAAGVDDAKEQP